MSDQEQHASGDEKNRSSDEESEGIDEELNSEEEEEEEQEEDEAKGDKSSTSTSGVNPLWLVQGDDETGFVELKDWPKFSAVEQIARTPVKEWRKKLLMLWGFPERLAGSVVATSALMVHTLPVCLVLLSQSAVGFDRV